MLTGLLSIIEKLMAFTSNGILFNHESPLRGETFVTRKITMKLQQEYPWNARVSISWKFGFKRTGVMPGIMQKEWG